MKNVDKLYIVIPCYNEEAVLYETKCRLKEKMIDMIKKNMISNSSRIVFCDDGSNDRTWSIIKEMHEKDPMILGIKLSRNRGHQNTLLGASCIIQI
ncbi:hypothetical protein C809_01991 [Lachnospiraceae bacterium MD335]|nr:hypothetical protein C809_01991 [Lachnospiraceae bacterium MD335]